ncbi:MAG: hypothetical protein ACLU77_10610 [Waltera sp.]
MELTLRLFKYKFGYISYGNKGVAFNMIDDVDYTVERMILHLEMSMMNIMNRF